MEIPLLKDLITIFALAIAVLFLCNRLRVPSIVGFLLTGILAGPYGLGLISAVKEVEILAEIGVVLLLFTIGVEFSLRSLLEIRRSVFLGGSLQVVLTIIGAFLVARQFHLSFGQSMFIGFLVSLSSTAIVLRILQERADIESPHGRTTLAILIFQDVAVVPMMLLVPVLAGSVVRVGGSSLLLLLKGAGIILLVGVGAKYLVPHMLYQIARTRSRELFLLSILIICFAVASLTHSLGLSLALGAFLAGLIISESEYGHQAMGNILPFRDVFTSLFFVSIGMLEDVGFLVNNPGRVLVFVVGIMVMKCLIAWIVVCSLGFPLRTGILTGLALCQIGEFSFILSMTGIEQGLLPHDVYQLFLAVSVLTMGATPFVITAGPRAASAVLRLPFPAKLKTGLRPMPATLESSLHAKLNDHIIIVGFGFNGRAVARAAKAAGIPYVIVEMNPETVKREKAAGEPIFYGDASQEAVLSHARILDARVMVVVISDPVATRAIVAAADMLNAKLHIIARTRFFQEMGNLQELGADEVIPEEFETSVEVFSRVLAKYLVTRDEIDLFVADARKDGYEMLRGLSHETAPLCDLELHLPDVEVGTIRLKEGSPLSGKSLGEIQLRRKYEVTLLAIRRGTQILSNPDGQTKLLADDTLIVLGSPSKLASVSGLLQNPGSGEES